MEKIKMETEWQSWGEEKSPHFLCGFMSVESAFVMINITNKILTKRLLMLTDQKYNDVEAAAVPVDF